MKTCIVTLSALCATLILSGCQPKSDIMAAIAETVVVGPQYSANKGLFVPEETRRSLGLKIVEMSEQKVVTTLELPLRVYDVSGDVVRASGSVSPEQAKALKTGQPLQLRTREGRSTTVTITALSVEMQQVAGAVEVLVQIPKSVEISVGSFIAAKVTLEAGESVATVPCSALIQAVDGYSVYTVSGDHFVRTPVKLGARNAEVAEIKEGLYAGDQVVSESAMSLWMTELAAVKGGHACCVVPAKGK